MAEAGAPLIARPRVIIAALGLAQIISWGSLYYAFSLLIRPLADATHTGPGTVVGAFSVALLTSGLASAPVGRLIDRHGGRWVMTCGSLAAGCLLIALAHAVTVWQLYALWAALGLAMAATLYDPAFTVLGQMFRGRQRQAITALTLFGGFASTVFWPLTQALMARFGWQQALLILGLLNLLVCASLHAWLLPRGRGAKVKGAGRSGIGAPRMLHDPVFYGLCIAFTGNALVFSAMSVHFIPLLQGKGMALSQAAWVAALIGPMQVLGRALEFAFLSRWHPSRVGALAMWLLPASLALLAIAGPHVGPMVAFALLYGSSNGVMTIVRGALPAELYGGERYGAVNGALAMPVQLSKAAGPLFASLVLAASGDALVMTASLAAVAAGSALVFAAVMRRTVPAISLELPTPP